MRLKEASKLGFSQALAPVGGDSAGVRLEGVARLADAVARIGEQAWDAPNRKGAPRQ
jgi:predicted ATP-dependent serine protease